MVKTPDGFLERICVEFTVLSLGSPRLPVTPAPDYLTIPSLARLDMELGIIMSSATFQTSIPSKTEGRTF